jgi:membrane protein implicated in regulation of membrane protease activity
MDWSWIVWLILMVVFLLVETSTVSLVSIWFAVGSLGALLAASLHAPLWVQITIFLALSATLLACLRPFVKKFIQPKIVATNADSVIGTAGFVTEDIDNLSARGQVKLGGMFWSARSTSGDPICKDTKVTVDRIEGVKVFVSPE